MPKRCATCGTQYADDLDGCPRCAKADAVGNLGNAISGCGSALFVLGITLVLAVCGLSSCGILK